MVEDCSAEYVMKKPSCGQERKELNQVGAGVEEGGCRQQDVTLRYTKGGKTD